ncbi:MAG TPA: ROK family protein [Phycisphaerae bacterium]|nr:ROK family protein [Phycisphaerae bacterium]
MADNWIGIDLGGTNIKAGIVADGGAVLARREVDTQADRGFEHVLARLVQLVSDLLADAGLDRAAVRAIGIGVPGPLSHHQGIVFSAPNMPGWENAPVRDRLSSATGLPVSLENDANAACFGELVAGAGRQMQDIVMLTLGTGVGSGIVLGGKLWRGSYDAAGEIGHTIVVPDGRPCPCGQRGCLERYASASAVGQRAVEAIAAGDDSTLAPLGGARGTAEAVTAEAVERAAAAGDALARRIWDETCYYLALACVNIRQTFDPQQVVLAGGLINAGDALMTPVRRHFDALRWRITPNRMRIDFATLGGNAGLIGAAALAQSEFG